jgi:hypothetical protein
VVRDAVHRGEVVLEDHQPRRPFCVPVAGHPVEVEGRRGR